LWAARKAGKTSEGYFLGNKSLTWPVIGASLFASNISTVHLVGLAESGFKDGIMWGNFEWFAVLELLVLAFVFIPFFLSTKITTLPEFMEKRYDNRSRVLLAIISIFAALFMHIGVSFYAGAVVFEKMFGVDITLSIIIVAAATGLYTILGGFLSVVMTETMQTILLVIGSVCVTLLALNQLPGIDIHDLQDLKAAVGEDKLKAVSFDASSNGFTFLDMLFGHMVLGIWYWCTDQTIVQRALGAKSVREAQYGVLFAGFLKILPVFIMVIPGILAYALYRDEIGADTKNVLPVLIIRTLPVGFKGLMLASLMAAVMSSVAAALNSCSTLIVYDVFSRIKTDLSDKMKIRVGRITSVLVLLLAVAWSPFLANLGSIFELINQMFSIFAPSIVTVFLWGVIYKRGTAHASFYTLLCGSIIALITFIDDKYVPIGGVINCISGSEGLGIHWLTQTYIFFIIASIIYFGVSLSGKQENQAHALQLQLRSPALPVMGIAGLLVALLLLVYIIFY
jgi:SSS family solute:Na+ symporter